MMEIGEAPMEGFDRDKWDVRYYIVRLFWAFSACSLFYID